MMPSQVRAGVDFRTEFYLDKSGQLTLIASHQLTNGAGEGLAFLMPALQRASIVTVSGYRFAVDHCELEFSERGATLKIIVIQASVIDEGTPS